MTYVWRHILFDDMATNSRPITNQDLIDRRCATVVDQIVTRQMRKAVNAVDRDVAINLSGRVLKKRTGNLFASRFTKVTRRRGEIVGFVGTNKFYGRIWELTGHRAFGPIRARYLRFKIGNTVIFTKHVRKVDPKPYLKPAVLKNKALITELIRSGVENAFSECLRNVTIEINLLRVKPGFAVR